MNLAAARAVPATPGSLQCQPPEIPDDAQTPDENGREAKALHSDPVEAWASIIETPIKRKALSRRVDAVDLFVLLAGGERTDRRI